MEEKWERFLPFGPTPETFHHSQQPYLMKHIFGVFLYFDTSGDFYMSRIVLVSPVLNSE